MESERQLREAEAQAEDKERQRVAELAAAAIDEGSAREATRQVWLRVSPLIMHAYGISKIVDHGTRSDARHCPCWSIGAITSSERPCP